MPPLDDEIMSAFLTPKKVGEICDKLLHSTDPDARMVGMYINDGLPPDYLEDAGINLPIEIAAAAAPEPKHVLDSAIRHATKGGKTLPPKTFFDHFQNAKNWGLALLQEYFFEIRKKICGKGKKPAALGQAANSALAALGTAVCKLLGLSNALGMGIAVLIITNAACIGKIALCRMTSPEELAKYFG
jgi:hypothetical protein